MSEHSMHKTEARALITAQEQVPVDVVGVAESLGINVWKTRLPDGISGKLFKDQNHGGTSGYSILVNADDSPYRVRFTIAHEIGHYMLHRHVFGDAVEDTVLYRSGLPDTKEYEANRFAAHLLVPDHLLRREILAGRAATNILVDRFHVSPEAMRIRLENFARHAGTF